jgi:hypothetical protein
MAAGWIRISRTYWTDRRQLTRAAELAEALAAGDQEEPVKVTGQ